MKRLRNLIRRMIETKAFGCAQLEQRINTQIQRLAQRSYITGEKFPKEAETLINQHLANGERFEKIQEEIFKWVSKDSTEENKQWGRELIAFFYVEYQKNHICLGMVEERTICVWPDYTWCDEDEVDQYKWKSDDYTTIIIPASLEDDVVDVFLREAGIQNSKEGQ